MANSPLEAAQLKWQQRQSLLHQAGIDPGQYTALMQKDLQNVAQGGQAISGDQVKTALLADIGNRSVIGNPSHSSSYNPLSIISNIPADVGGLVRGLNPVTLANSLGNMIGNTAALATGRADKAYRTKHNLTGTNLEQASSTVLGLIPGFTTAAHLGSGHVAPVVQHPVGTALDVLPIAAKGGKLLAAAKEGEVIAEGSAREAFAAGNPIKGAMRAASDKAAEIPHVPNVREHLAALSDSLGFSQAIREGLMRPYNILTKRAQADVMGFFKENVAPLFAEATAEDLAALSLKAQRLDGTGLNYFDESGQLHALTDHEAAVFQSVRGMNEVFAKEGIDQGKLIAIPMPDGRFEYYAAGDSVAKSYSKLERAASNSTKAEANAQRAIDRAKSSKAPDDIEKAASLAKKAKKAQKSLKDRQNLLTHDILTHPAARFHPYLVSKIRSSAETMLKDATAGMTAEQVRVLLHGQTLDTALQTLRNSPLTSQFEALLGKGEFNALYQDVATSWLDLSKKGLDPLWMHHLTTDQLSRVLSPRVLPDHFSSVDMFKKKTMNFAPGVLDISAAVTEAGKEVIQQKATAEYINNFVKPFAKPYTQLLDEYTAALDSSKLDPRINISAKAIQDMTKEYHPIEVDGSGVNFPLKPTKESTLMVPTGVYRSLKSLMDQGPGGRASKLGIYGPYDKSMKLYKFSVLTGPRHLVHVAIGGSMMLALRDPAAFAKYAEAWKAVKGGTAPVELTQDLYNLKSDQIHATAVGKSYAKHLVEAVGDKARALARLEENIASTQRTAEYLSQVGKGVSHDAALQSAYKVFVDMDGMSAIERTIIKQVFPFYGFTRHLFRYLFSYPIDHPLRAAILSKFAEQEQQDWTSGLPQAYQQLFFLGAPDKNGNVFSVDVKSINPFRSFANDFTLTGLISSLNPAITAGMQVAGINTLQGVSELYPQIAYDPVSGSLQAKRPADALPKVLSSYVPQFGALDHFFQITQNMKQLKRSNPAAYRQTLFSQLNLPFAMGRINVPLVKEQQEMKRYRVAQSAVAQGEKSGDFAGAKRFARVPYQGALVDPQALARYWDTLLKQMKSQGLTGVSPKAIMRPQPRRKSF